MTISRSKIRQEVIREMYGVNLIKQLFEQDAPTPPDPTAPAAPAAPDPTAPAAPDPTAPAAPDPTAPAVPAVPDPTTAPAAPAAPVPGVIPSPDPTTIAGTPAIPAPGAPPTPGTAAAGSAAKKPSKPDPEKQPMKSQVNKALVSAMSAATDNGAANESIRTKSLRFLFEADDAPQIDIGVYAGKIANLIKNYTSLIDIKKNVITQAEQYLDDEFPGKSDPLKKELRNLLRQEYHISLERSEPPSDAYAVGAGSGGGGAA